MSPSHRKAPEEDLEGKSKRRQFSPVHIFYEQIIFGQINISFLQRCCSIKINCVNVILCNSEETATGFVVTLLMLVVNQSGVTSKPESLTEFLDALASLRSHW